MMEFSCLGELTQLMRYYVSTMTRSSKDLFLVKFTWEFVDLPRDDVLIVMKRNAMPVDITGCPPTHRKLQDQKKEEI